MRRARRSPDTRRPLVVLQSFPAPRSTTNPYLVQLERSLPAAEVAVLHWSWRTAVLGRYDVLHVHWPEILVRSPRRSRRLARRAALAVLVARLAATSVPVVRTVHNPSPHEALGRADRLLLRALEGRTRRWIRLNGTTATPDPTRTVTVPHGDYRAWFAGYTVPPARPGTLLYFGLVRPYKGVETLLEAFARVPGHDLRLRVVGAPSTPALRQEVLALAARDPRVGTLLEYADDATLAREVGEAELVVLPYRDMHNSGAALLALSLGRPVLVPAGPATDELARELGADWVLRYDPALGVEGLAQGLADALTTGRARPPSAPDLSGRDWPGIGAAHARVYAEAASAAGA